MSEVQPISGETVKDYQIEVTKAVLEVDQPEKLKEKLDHIRLIAQKEKQLIEFASKIDDIDNGGRADDIPTRFYGPNDSTYSKYYVLAPDLTSFPILKAKFNSSHPLLSDTIEFGINPVMIDAPIVIASTTEITGRESSSGVAMILDYTKPIQELDVRVLTVHKKDLSAWDYGEELWGPLFEQIELTLPKSEDT